MDRKAVLWIVALFLLAIPVRLYFSLTSPGMGYDRLTAGLLAGVIAAAMLAVVPVAFRVKPTAAAAEDQPLSPRAGWGVFLGFLAAVVAVLAYFALKVE